MISTDRPSEDWNASDARVVRFGWGRRFATALTRLQGPAALRSVGAEPLRDGEGDRLRNVVAGLAERLELPAPRLYLYEGAANAFVIRSGGGAVAIERSFVDALARTEVEAVAAHCLVRLGSATRLGDPVGYDDDVKVAALTRFPPALASALAKAEPERGRFAPLYLAAEHPSHRLVAERIAALEDL